MKKVGIVSLGCSKNLVDSENILGLFDYNNYSIVNDPKEADIIVINTCGFIEESKKESIQTIFEMLEYHKKVVVTGCLVERYYDQIKKEIPEIDLIIPIKDYYRFNELLSTLDDEIIKSGGVNDEYRIVSTGPFSAYLKIGEGCSNCCSYCAIPLIRGPYHSRDLSSIIKESKELVEAGIKELILLEQDTSRYGSDFIPKLSLVDLLKNLESIEGLESIRLLYLYPDEINDELIDYIATSSKVAPYFDIPIQHSEDHILRDMNRRGDKKYLYQLFNKIKDKIPNAILRTTLLLGFPGETEQDVNNLKEFIKDIEFDHLGAFSYSREEGTLSYNFDNQIDESIKKERVKNIMKLQQRISYNKNKGHINELMNGYVVGKDHDYYLIRSYWNAPDDVDGKILMKSELIHNIGDKVNLKITDAFVYDLMGEEI